MFSVPNEDPLLEAIKRDLAENSEQQRLIALQKALTLGQQGLDLFTQQSLQDKSENIRQSAYWILHQYNPYLSENSKRRSSNDRIFPTDTITCLAITPDNHILVGGSWQKIFIGNLQTGELLRTINAHSHWILSVAISLDGKTLISSSLDTIIKIWDLKLGLLIRQINAHNNWVNAVNITPDSKTIVSASADKTIKIWDISTGKLQHTLEEHSGDILSIAISSDGKIIASGSTDNTVKIWNLESGKLYQSLEGHLDWVQAVTISQDNKFLISGSRDGDIKIWQADSDEKNNSETSNADNTNFIAKIIEFIFLIVISKLRAGAVFWLGAPFLYSSNISGSKNKQNSALNLANLKCIHSIHQDLTDTVNNLIINNNENLISISDDNNIKQWCIKTKQLIRSFKGHTGFISSAAVSSDNKILVSGGSDWIKVWNLQTGQLLHPIKGSTKPKLTHTSIVPRQIKLECDQCQTFKIQGTDQHGVKINIQELSWQAQGGNIDQSGLFVAGNQEGKYTVTGITGNLETSASVIIIEPAKLTQMIITPQKITLKCGKSQRFNIQGLDQRGARIVSKNLSWQATGGTIDANGNFYAGQNPGEFAITASVEAVKACILITLIEPPKLEKIIISPRQRSLTFGNTLYFSAKGLDQYGNNIKLGKVVWSATGGNIFPDGRLQAINQEQEITVTARVGDISASTVINVIEAPKLTELIISPPEVIMKPGEQQKFSIQGLDQSGNAIAVEKIVWSATGGTIDQNGTFVVNQSAKGNFNISACAVKPNVSVSAKVFVPLILQRLEILPKQVDIEPKQIQSFTVKAFDQEETEISAEGVSWQCTTGGTINNDIFIGNYDADTVEVVANVGNVSDVAYVRLLPVLRSLEIKPKITHLKPNEQINFTAKGFDQFKNEVEVQDIYWQTTQGKIYSDGTFVAVSIDADITVSATVGSIVGKTHFKIVEPSRLTQLVISPEKVVINPEQYQHFEVIGLDQRGDAIAISGINWKATSGKIDQAGNYLAGKDQKGQFTIIASIGRLSVSANVIIPPALQQLEIFPSQIQLTPEETEIFTIVGFDQQNVEIKLEKVNWKSTQGGSISQQGIFEGGYTHREVTVTASIGNVKQSAYVKLLPVLRKLQISPPSVKLKPNERQTFTVIGIDQFDDECDPGKINWESTGGDIDKNGNFTADHHAKGQFLVTATSYLTPKLTKKSRAILFNISLSLKILSYIVRVVAQVQDKLILDSNNEESEANIITIETAVEAYDFNPSIENWISKTFIKFIAKFLTFISRFCFKQATACLSVSAEITIVPVIRYLEIYPEKAKINPPESINFTIQAFDQHFYPIKFNNVYWRTTSGDINSNGTLSSKCINNQCKNITVTATVENIDKSVDIAVVYTPQITATQNDNKQAFSIIDKISYIRDIALNHDNDHESDISNQNYLDSSFEYKSQSKEYLLNALKVNDEDEKAETEILLDILSFNDKFECDDLDDEDSSNDTEYTYKCAYVCTNTSFNSIVESNSWFYRSQLFYDGYSKSDIIDYHDYLDYQNIISYIQFQNDQS
ncbi:hypothetical protein A6769_35580 [Nostoc punctiforme NIES-2108]|uniref:Uncharacterized protein n=1 Tax=Nostoc punctiforme NIES-2108 TaxID=1356359 RepID=A0A367R1S9_NOSPU|nr:hypothetical protein A6769_35580 [Nostoc punctiforme NIES-2108]